MKYKITYQENGKLKQKTITIENNEDIKDSLELPNNIVKIKQLDKLNKNYQLFKNDKKYIYELFKQLNIMLSSNLTLNQSIELLLKTNNDKIIKSILLAIQSAIKTAQPLDEALRGYKKYLGSTPILFLKLGVENGNIKESINSLVSILSEDINSNEKFKEAIRYPIILLILLFISMGMIFVYVIPNFEFVFQMLGDDIPFATKSLLFIKDMVENYFYIVILVLAITPMIFYAFYKKYRYFFDRLLILKIAVFSRVLKDYYFYRLFLSISIIVKSKYQFQVAILNSKNIVQNRYIQNAMNNILTNIKNGASIAQSFEDTKLFDDLAIKLLYTAQHTNQYELILHDITSFYKQRFQDSLKNFSTFIEPVMILIISLVVLWLIMAIMLPVWNMGAILG
ncbi:MAG: type II secretion system F family protein [Campylobacterota bacterium]|nr:type II secretion system F family protein [Campylobacterota bacterium]